MRSIDPHDIDVGAVESGQHRAGDDLVDRADRGLAPPKIEDAVDGVEQRIELMRAEQDRDLELLAEAPRDFDGGLVMRRIRR